MTLPPIRIGDKGQRFEVQSRGYPENGVSVVGWSNTAEGAERLMKSIKSAPGCIDAWVVDRGEKDCDDAA